ITPPVALAAFAGAAIAKCDPMKAGFNATRLAIAAFLVPYIFAINPTMLLMDKGIFVALQIIVTSLLGLFGIAACLNGHLFTKINPLFRIALAAGGLCMMVPGTLTDVVGIALVIGICVVQRIVSKKALKEAA
ncbi:MAG: TRAP transporter permease, partial [Oscillospiraceae bacterium]|nr:TRAP transporter permease [Oscillospiraceae bacterium]